MAKDAIEPKPKMNLRVVRKGPELVAPAKPTPRETKELSDIDDQGGLRFQIPGILFYRADPLMEGKDRVKVVKEALAKALVFYYPLAGRLREVSGHKLAVDCTGEGVLFIEADANEVTLEDFGDVIHPPFPLDDLLYDVPGTQGIVDTPLFIVQVTRLKCGGFIVAVRGNHVVTDGTGKMQFLKAVGEMARGLPSPVVRPVWQRERLTARPEPRITFTHHEYDEATLEHGGGRQEQDNLAHHSLVFGAKEFAALKGHVQANYLKGFSTFDILTTCLWRCRTIALGLEPNEEVRLFFSVNARTKYNPPLPKGYYGNACAFPVVRATVREITENPLTYSLDLIKQSKIQVTEKYMRSVADLMVIRGKPPFNVDRTYVVSDLRHLGCLDIDFGWGEPAYGGPTNNGVVPDASFYISIKDKSAESLVMVPIALPANVMDKFLEEVEGLLKQCG